MSDVQLRMNYADATFIEFALVDFIEHAKGQITALQSKEGQQMYVQRKELLKIYENRLRNGKRLLAVVSEQLNHVEEV